MFTAGQVTIQNGTLINANQEYKITLPQYYKKISIQARQYAPVKFSFVENESGTNYMTLKPGVSYWEDNIRHVGDLYVQTPTPGTIVEVLTWYGGDNDR